MTRRRFRLPRRGAGGRITASVYVALVLIFLFAPLVVVVLVSFSSTSNMNLSLSGFSIRWYQQIGTDPLVVAAFGRTALAAIATALISGVLGLLGALGAVRLTRRWRTAVFTVPLVPLAFPALLFGIGLATFYHAIGLGFSIWATIAGHVILALPFVFLVLGAALERFRFSLLEAARDLGAGSFTIFRTVTLPLLRPAILGAMFLSMAISVDEFVIAFFTAGSQQTLPLVLYGRINLGVNPGLNAIGSILLAVTMGLAFLAARTSVLEIP
jgi:spermidine/putrescine transport system permease protein